MGPVTIAAPDDWSEFAADTADTDEGWALRTADVPAAAVQTLVWRSPERDVNQEAQRLVDDGERLVGAQGARTEEVDWPGADTAVFVRYDATIDGTGPRAVPMSVDRAGDIEPDADCRAPLEARAAGQSVALVTELLDEPVAVGASEQHDCSADAGGPAVRGDDALLGRKVVLALMRVGGLAAAAEPERLGDPAEGR